MKQRHKFALSSQKGFRSQSRFLTSLLYEPLPSRYIIGCDLHMFFPGMFSCLNVLTDPNFANKTQQRIFKRQQKQDIRSRVDRGSHIMNANFTIDIPPST